MRKINLSFILIISLFIITAFSRVIPHLPNFTPLAALALFGSAHFKNKYYAFLIPLIAVFLSDLFINNKLSKYNKLTQPLVVDKLDRIIWVPGLAHGNIKELSKHTNSKIIEWVQI